MSCVQLHIYSLHLSTSIMQFCMLMPPKQNWVTAPVLIWDIESERERKKILPSWIFTAWHTVLLKQRMWMISPNANWNWKAIKSFPGRCHAGLADCYQHFRWRTSIFFLLPKLLWCCYSPQYYIQYMRKSEIITHIFHALWRPMDKISLISKFFFLTVIRLKSETNWVLKE